MRGGLQLRLFVSYLAVIGTAVAALWLVLQWTAPVAFEYHMGAMMGAGRGMGRMMAAVMTDAMNEALRELFFRGLRSALGWAVLAAVLTAVGLAYVVSRRITSPIRAVVAGTRRVAQGRYDQRIQVNGPEELAELAKGFNQMAEALAAAESRRLALIGDVAHELKTPLTTIEGYMEGLLDGVTEPSSQTYALVAREASRLRRLVEDLEELSRAEGGRLSLEPRPVPLAGAVKAATARLESQYQAKEVSLAVNLPRDLPRVWADEDRIAQVLTNLLGNALQYTPAGGRVSVTATHAGGHVEVAVSDTGEGIAAEHLPHLFERFYRVDKSRARASGGSGVGLTIARSLVEAHGGRIWAESAGPGQGSTFRFTLPTARP